MPESGAIVSYARIACPTCVQIHQVVAKRGQKLRSSADGVATCQTACSTQLPCQSRLVAHVRGMSTPDVLVSRDANAPDQSAAEDRAPAQAALSSAEAAGKLESLRQQYRDVMSSCEEAAPLSALPLTTPWGSATAVNLKAVRLTQHRFCTSHEQGTACMVQVRL